MNMGLGFSEILVIAALILIFFGSKELPALVRELAKFTVKVRLYSDKMRRELDEISKIDQPSTPVISESRRKKEELRKQLIAARKEIAQSLRDELSQKICAHLMESDAYRKARSVMVYVNMGSEVATRDCIGKMLADGKRVVVPYCSGSVGQLGIGEIKDLDNDIVKGAESTPEPRKELHGNFFKSDIQLIVCPGVAFDILGGRLGRGKAYYDRFLAELKGRAPIVGLAFGRQILREALPFDYNDIRMDQIFTESGPQLPAAVAPEEVPGEKSPVLAS